MEGKLKNTAFKMVADTNCFEEGYDARETDEFNNREDAFFNISHQQLAAMQLQRFLSQNSSRNFTQQVQSTTNQAVCYRYACTLAIVISTTTFIQNQLWRSGF